ncbi:MAG TPA: hypothetical protein VGF99_19515 [Myxococcota bacterium]
MTSPATPNASEVAAVVDGVRVVIDLGAFHLARHAALLTVSAVLSAVALVACVVAVERGKRKRLGLAVVGAAVGGALTFAAAPVLLGVYGRWLPGLGLHVSQGSVLATAVGALGAALVVAVPITLLSSTRGRLGWIACGLGIVASIVGVVAVGRAQRERRDIIAALKDADPLPRFVFVGQTGDAPLPEVHVGRTRTLKPERVVALETSGALLAATSALSATAQPRWNVNDVVAELTARTAGEHTATAIAVRGIVRVEQPVRFVAINDTAPAAFPLSPGKRFVWSGVRGGRGSVDDAEKDRRAKKRNPKIATATTSAVVLDDRIDNGLRIARVQTVIDGRQSTTDVVARNGQLVRAAGGPFLTMEAGTMCNAVFLGFDRCTCTSTGIEKCTRYDGDRVGSALRVGMIVATGGLSEFLGGCKGCGDGKEVGLLLDR